MQASVDKITELIHTRVPESAASIEACLKSIQALILKGGARSVMGDMIFSVRMLSMKEALPPHSIESDVNQVSSWYCNCTLSDQQLRHLAEVLLEKHAVEPDVEIVSVHSAEEIRTLCDAQDAVTHAERALAEARRRLEAATAAFEQEGERAAKRARC